MYNVWDNSIIGTVIVLVPISSSITTKFILFSINVTWFSRQKYLKIFGTILLTAL